MNSSTGFKKRNLLRPPSGILSNQKQFLKIFDISQSEPFIASNIRTQLASIQEQINLLDKDKKIRTGEVSLEKSYILTLKKWLKEMQIQTEKEDDDAKILKHLGVDSYEAGFKKLWKLLTYIDLMTSKVTELEIVQFLKYDQGFSTIANDSPNGERILQTIGKGVFSPSNFYLSQLSLERYQELYATASGLKRQNHSGNTNRSSFKQTQNDSSQLIEELKNENKKLSDLLNSLEKEKQTKKSESRDLSNRSPQSLFEQIEEKYKGQLQNLNEKIKTLNHLMMEQKIHIETIESQLKVADEELKSKEYKQNVKPKSGSYEEALLEEMNKMKNGFERKISRLLEEFSGKEKESRKREYELKNDNEKLKWQKGLLLKKFDAISS